MGCKILAISWVAALVACCVMTFAAFAQDDSLSFEKVAELSFWDRIVDMEIQGNYAYLASSATGLRIIDISQKANPEEVSFVEFEDAIHSLVLNQNYAYLRAGKCLEIVDITDPRNPIPHKDLQFNLQFFIYDMALYQNFIYLAINDSLIQILDISDPACPHPAGSFTTMKGELVELFVCDEMLIVKARYFAKPRDRHRVSIFSLANPQSPELIAEYDDWVMDLDIYKGFLYLTCGEAGVKILDLTEPASLTEVAGFKLNNNVWNIDIFESNAFISAAIDSGRGVLYIYDLSSPIEPDLMATVEFDSTPREIRLFDSTLYVSTPRDGIYLLNISDISNPEIVSHLNRQANFQDIELYGDYALTVGWGKGLSIFDLTEPASPRLVRTFDAFGADKIIIDDTVAYAGGSHGVRLLDISNPLDPALINQIAVRPKTRGFDYDNGRLYVVDADSGLYMYDVSSPENPMLLTRYQLNRPMEEIYVYGSWVCVKEMVPETITVLARDGAHSSHIATSKLNIYNFENIEHPELVSNLSHQSIIHFYNNFTIAGSWPHYLIRDLSGKRSFFNTWFEETYDRDLVPDQQTRDVINYLRFDKYLRATSEKYDIDLGRNEGKFIYPSRVSVKDNYLYRFGTHSLSVYKLSTER